MPKQGPDAYEANPKDGLRGPERAQGAPAKEFVTRLKLYGKRLGTVSSPNAVQGAVQGVVDGMTREGGEWGPHREKLSGDLRPLIENILAMEWRWFLNVCKAHESAERYFDENRESYLVHSDLVPAQKKLETLLSQQKTVQQWSSGVLKAKRLQELDAEIQKARARTEETLKIQARYGDGYFDGLRLYLRGAGFLVAPSYLPPAAIFPREDWVSLESDPPSYDDLVRLADELMQKYRILGTPYAGVLFKTATPEGQDKCGCVCVSWVKATCVTDGNPVMVPTLGMSGGAPAKTNVVGIEAMLAACALPPYRSLAGEDFGTTALEPLKNNDEVIFNRYYDDIMARANNLAINYRVREFLQLRLPSRQAMLSYLGLSFFVASPQQVSEMSTPITPTPGVARWHSLNCAEPAALAWISSFFVDGQDVYLCCPYEGKDNPGGWGLKPKETCPWCATVEIAYRSLKKVPRDEQGQWTKAYDQSMKTGEWAREITFADQFKGTVPDKQWREDLPRNKAMFELAYPGAVNDNVARLREIFREVGLLETSTIRIGEPALWQKG